MLIEEVTWKIGGPAGFGIMSTGLMFSRMYLKKGFNIVDGNEYPSLIQGGHNTYTVRVSKNEIYSLIGKIDVLVALDKLTAEMHRGEISFNGTIFYDEEDFVLEDLENKKENIKYIMLPMTKITKDIDAPKLSRNNVALGASAAFLDYDLDMLREIIEVSFASKGKEVVDINTKAAEKGYSYIREIKNGSKITLNNSVDRKNLLLSGNDAIVLGAVRSGCKFYCAYPMTPASSLLHSFAANEKEFNILVKHAESELAVINMALGASFVGSRSMVATSGGGFALMNEGLAAVAMTETPMVIVLAQRPAPATGLPTWTEQGDMLYAVNAAHGEFLRLVLAPGDIEDCFYLTGKAFNLADKYQIPVIILMDKYLSESHFSIDDIDPDKISIDRGELIKKEDDVPKDYKRYAITENGVSKRTLVGLKGGVHIANTDEHDEYGFSEESGQNRKQMMDKRFRKVKDLIKEIPGPKLYGPSDTEITFISWGSCKGPILEALKLLNQKNGVANLIHFNCLYPFDKEGFMKLIEGDSKKIVVENNKTSQLSKIIMMNTGTGIKSRVLKYSGRQFLPEEIAGSAKVALDE